jgi:uncharacterized membrane protein YgaE (UPF0421/DUF939 family)
LKIGYRTLKTAIGTAISIFIAQILDLEFYSAAGILTILSIQVTRRRSLKISLDRFVACVLGLFASSASFFILGYNPFTILVLLIILIPTFIRLKIKEGFVTSFVIILQVYTLQEISMAIIANQLQVITIGIGVALLMNAYMPNIDKMLIQYREKVEHNFSVILKEFATYLRKGETTWDGKEMVETLEILEKAKGLALQEVENHLLRNEDAYYHYFAMREKQFELLERMLPIISTLHHQVPHGERLAGFIEDLSNHIHPKNTAHLFLDKLNEIRKENKVKALPQTREEFEIRASLFYLLNEMEQYLFIKQSFKQNI